MNVFQVFQSMLPSSFQHKHLVLHNGQVVNATLMDMFANGDAKISIQGHVVRAKLETPLAKGEHTFMQVKSFQNGVVTMKILGTDEGKQGNVNVPTANINTLLKSSNLPQTQVWRDVVQQLITRNIPLVPAILQNGLEVLGKQPTQEQQQTWITMLERGLPINTDSFRAIHQLLYGQSITNLVNQFRSLVDQYMQTVQNSNQALPANQNALLSNLTQLFNQLFTNSMQLHTQASQGQQQAQQGQIPQELTQTQTQQTQQSQPSQLSQQLQQTQSTQQSQPLPNIQQTQQSPAGLPVNQPQSQQQSQNLQQSQVMQAIQNQTGTEAQPRAQALPTQNPVIPEVLSKEQPHSREQMQVSQSVASTAQTGLQASETIPRGNEGHPLANIFRLLGYQHENRLLSLSNEFHQLPAPKFTGASLPGADNIKQLLLHLSSNTTLPLAIRETASQIINNITGQQLFSMPQDSQSLYQSVMVQIPMAWNDKQHDTLKIQIQGRKEKRAIDPNNCSIYLELRPPNLGELGVFVHIVNKVVSIKLFSEFPYMKQFIQQSDNLLKQGLSEQGFQLSYIKVESFIRETKPEKQMEKYTKAPTKGFDIRV